MVVQNYRSGADPRYESEGAQGGGGAAPPKIFFVIFKSILNNFNILNLSLQ